MKKFAIICMAVLVLHSGAAAHAPKNHASRHLPAICSNQDGILLAMPGSCSGFFICVNGNAIASSCGDFFHFNARTGYCDHPLRAACLASQPPPLVEPEMMEQLQVAPPQVEDPTTYLPIMPMLPTIAATPSSQLDQPIPRPQHPDEVVADIDAGAICQKQRNGVQLSRTGGGGACSQFYVCIMRRPYRRTCPVDKQFSVAHGMCVVPALAQCNEPQSEAVDIGEKVEKAEKEVLTPPTPAAPLILPRPIYASSSTCAGVAPGVLLPHPMDCDKFLSCSSRGRAFEMRCPTGLHFSATQRHCDWPQYAKCAEYSFQ